MFKTIVFFLFNNRECFEGKLDQRMVAKSEVTNEEGGKQLKWKTRCEKQAEGRNQRY